LFKLEVTNVRQYRSTRGLAEQVESDDRFGAVCLQAFVIEYNIEASFYFLFFVHLNEMIGR